MGSIDEIMQVCRLCLVKDKVNIPIFDESNNSEEIFNKICSCLPVKVSREDNLPKKICDGCSYKLELLYTFRNTSVDSEKQLMSLLNQAGLSACSLNSTLVRDATKPEVLVKQETLEPADSRMENENSDVCPDAQSYIMQQQQLPYQQDFAFAEASGSSEVPTEEPPPKRARRSNPVKKPPVQTDSEDEDLDLAMQITKAEDEDSDDVDQPDYVEPSTSADDQPGPSGVGKDVVEAPLQQVIINYKCDICSKEFPNKNEFMQHHFRQYGKTFDCCNCGEKYNSSTELYAHFEIHRNQTNTIEVVEEIILNYENEEDINENTEVLYVYDDSQGVNEVVVEDLDINESLVESDLSNNVTIVQADHEYVVPTSVESLTDRGIKKRNSLNGERMSILTAVLTPAQKTRPRSRPLPSRSRPVVPNFSTSRYVEVEANEEIGIDHLKCLRCEQLFIKQDAFLRHVEKAKCYIRDCELCSATFTTNSDFYDHYVTEHRERAVCRFCFSTFMYEKNIKEHMLRHLDKFKVRCEKCNKGFYTSREFRNHYNNRHLGVRHECMLCGRSFGDEYYFKRHLIIHQQENADVVAVTDEET